MESNLYKEYVGSEPETVYLDHAGRGGFLVGAGVSRLRDSVGPATRVGDENIARYFAEITGFRRGTIKLCNNVQTVVTRLIKYFKPEYDPADPPPIYNYTPGHKSSSYFLSIVEPFTGKYNSAVDCTKFDVCLIDATYSLGVRRLPDIEYKSLIAFARLDKWLMHPGEAGILIVDNVDIEISDCNPLPLISKKYLEGVLSYLLSKGMPWIEERILSLTNAYGWLLDKAGYTPITPPEQEYRAGIITFRLHSPIDEVKRIARKLEDKWVFTSLIRGKFMRISPNFYNDENDIDHILRALP